MPSLQIIRCYKCITRHYGQSLNKLLNNHQGIQSKTWTLSYSSSNTNNTDGTEKESTNVTEPLNEEKSIKIKIDPTELIDSQIHKLDIPHVKYRPQHHESPIHRTATILKDDLSQYFKGKAESIKKIIPKGKEEEGDELNAVAKTSEKKSSLGFLSERKEIWPSTCDILIVGGGIMGSSIAYHLKERTRAGLDIVVLEKDNSYSQASTVRSVGGIRQQFSVPENIQLSMYGMEFIRQAPELLHIAGRDPVNVNFHPNGYLTLASEAGFDQLKENFMIQREVGAKVQFLSPAHIKERFPWMNLDGVAAGVLGLENEGWFDPWSLLIALRHKSAELGTVNVQAEFMGAEFKDSVEEFIDGTPVITNRMLDHAHVKLPDGELRTIKFAILIIAAGAWSGEVGRRLGIGVEGKKGSISIPIPIEPRKRFVYCVHSPNGPGLHSPLVVDPNGTYFRREGLGDMYLCGQSPLDEPSTTDLDVDEEFFAENVWPTIAHRVPAFENLKLKSSWAGYYDYNYFDRNGIVGKHPNFTNVVVASGFSGHGLQQGPGIGRGIAEYIIYNKYTTIDLGRLSYDRILMRQPLLETNIV